jgi:maleylpyruvate isomerase
VTAHLGTIGVKAEDIAEWSRHWIRVGIVPQYVV